MSRPWQVVAALVLTVLAGFANAHEIRPAYLEIKQNAAQHVNILWKQPIVGNVAVPIEPQLSAGWLDPDTATTVYTDTFLIRRWQLDNPSEPLGDQTLTIFGLEGSLTDVLVRIVDTNANETLHIIKPDSPTLVLSAASKPTLSVIGYLVLGVEHIWTGIDHLLFVFGLMLLASRFVHLLKTITAFTIAHSITLAAAALKLVRIPTAPVEAVIALSIIYLAVELIYVRRGREGLAHRFPWLVAFTFGLLHGFGFAGALNQVGLPADSIPLALLCFNIGIELGQITFVAGVLLLLALLTKAGPRISLGVQIAAPHVIGSLAAFWFFERLSLAFF